MLKPIEKQRVAEEIVTQLRSLILTGQYAPGAKLPPERELAKTLGVNRASLREALKKLEHLGLVRIRQGDGTRVQDYMETAGIELISHLIIATSADPKVIGDVLEFRRMIGRECARLAASRASGEDLDRLAAIAQRAADESQAADEVFRIDFEFYVAMTVATNNKILGLLVNTVRGAVESYMPVLANLAVSAETVREHHRDLMAALRAHDPDAAANVADAYLKTGADHIVAMMSQGQLPK